MDAEQRLPGALLAVMPDDVRLRRAKQAAGPLPRPCVPGAGGGRSPGGLGRAGVAPDLRRRCPQPSLRPVLCQGRLESCPPNPRRPERQYRTTWWSPKRTERTRDHPSVSLGQAPLPVLLKPAEKRLLECLSQWPFITPEDLGGHLDVSKDGVLKLVARLSRLELVSSVHIGNRRRLGPRR